MCMPRVPLTFGMLTVGWARDCVTHCCCVGVLSRKFRRLKHVQNEATGVFRARALRFDIVVVTATVLSYIAMHIVQTVRRARGWCW